MPRNHRRRGVALFAEISQIRSVQRLERLARPRKLAALCVVEFQILLLRRRAQRRRRGRDLGGEAASDLRRPVARACCRVFDGRCARLDLQRLELLCLALALGCGVGGVARLEGRAVRALKNVVAFAALLGEAVHVGALDDGGGVHADQMLSHVRRLLDVGEDFVLFVGAFDAAVCGDVCC